MSFSIDRRRLPPLNALIAFEAAARLGSFALAGTEIHLTASAISRQIKSLEDHLGVQLFDRVRQRIVLTEAGRFLALQVRHTLRHLLAVSDQAAHLRTFSRTLNIGVLPAFANYWLIPRMSQFLSQHEDIQLNLVSIGSGFDYDNGGVDAAIHINAKLWSDATAVKLGNEEMIAVASPEWMSKYQPRSAEELTENALLELSGRPYLWTQWFEHNEVQITRAPRQLKFGNYSMVFEAVFASLGVALLPRMLTHHYIAMGRLVEGPGRALPIGAGYFLVQPVHRDDYPPLLAFRQWLMAQVGGVDTPD